MARRSMLVRLGTLMALVAAVFAVSATLAFAGPSEPTLGVVELQQKLDASGGHLHGYLKTVDKGSTITTIDVDVLAVTTGYGSGPVDMSSLIYFQAYGTKIDEIGGIAAGMSGSPIYVNVDGEDKLIGALSYGDIFALDGAGLATPIEAMAAMQDTYAAASLPRRLASPVIVGGEIKDKVQIVSDPDAVKAEPAGTIVAKPLAAAYIGGMNPKSRMYKAAAAHLTKAGMDVVPLAGGLSAKESTYDAPFEAGSAVAALASRGDLWVGGIGTVTYVDTSTPKPEVVAFGHSAFWEGETSLYMSNAWIDGVWPSSYEAYKLARPATLRGELTQDRLEGIVGVDGQLPTEAKITARALNEETGQVATSSVELPSHVINSSGYDYYGLAAEGAWIASSRVFNAYTIPGSANTTTTVVVRDAVSLETTTIVRTNRYSDPDDITMAAVSDVNDIVSSFEEANGNGIAHADIVSVDLDTTFHKQRNEAEVVSVDVAGGLKHGNNTATVSLLLYGEPDTHTVDIGFNIPANVPLTGELTAMAVNDSESGGFSDGESYSDMLASDFESGSESYITTDRRTVSDVIKQLRSAVDNTTLKVTFLPEDLSDSGDPTAEPVVSSYDPIEASTATTWTVFSGVAKIAPTIDLYTEDDTSVYSYGDRTYVLGDIFDATSGSVTVTGSDITTKTLPLSEGSFSYLTPELKHTTTLTFTYSGDSETLAAQETLVLKVAAKTTFKTSKTSITKGHTVTLAADVLPKTAGGHVAFQRWNGYMWSTLKTLDLPSSGKVTYTYKPSSKGSVKLRAYYLGSSVAVKSGSKSITVKVK